MPHDVTRRNLLGFSALTASFLVLGDRLSLSPAEAVELDFTPEILTRDQLKILELVAEHLVPGSVDAGIGAYLDAQLRAGEDSLLIGKYVGVDISAQIDFYKSLASNLQRTLQSDASTPAVVSALWGDALPDWEGPPASYMLFVLRADALDVTYGTPEGFEALGIPYMAHIMPEKPW
tara:strand:- start:147 stop:677 length:531 start_codon:yes stop_codon:yes gene_type:complete